MTIDNTLRDFISDFSDGIKNASGFVEVYYAFASLDNASKWVENCHQNLLEIYNGAKDLQEQLRRSAPIEDLWPALDDLSFHSAIFSCYYFMFDSLLSAMLIEKGDYSSSTPKQITSFSSVASLENVLSTTIEEFQNLINACDNSDVSGQRKYLSKLYLATVKLQLIAANNKV